MAKTLILSEKQINEIIDGTPYLDTDDKGMPENMYLNQTSVTGGIKNPKPITGDEISKWEGQPTNNWTIHGAGAGKPSGIPIVGLGEVYTKKDFEEKMLMEMNSQLNNINMNVSIPNDNNPNQPFNLNGKEGKLAKYKTLAKQSGDRETYAAISKVLDSQRARIKSDKQTKAAAGMTNQFQKPGGVKKNTGTAHTKKNNSLISVIDPQENNI